jgi:hypothetical protein
LPFLVHLTTHNEEAFVEPAVLANWHQRLENFQFSSQEFYTRLQTKLKERKYPEFRFDAVQHHERGVFTPKRDYLRITRHALTFDISAAPFGVDFFISWWLLEKPRGCGCLLLLGPLGSLLARRTTYYEEDTAVIFRETVHATVLDVLAELLGDEGAAVIAKVPPPTVAKSPLV